MRISRPDSREVAILVLTAAYVGLIAVPIVFLYSATAVTPFFGEQPSAEAVAHFHHVLWADFGLALAACTAGLLAGLRLDSGVTVVLMTAALSAVVAVGLLAGVKYDKPVDPGPVHCQERSGGDTDCPGG